jgi:hypothetical protein
MVDVTRLAGAGNNRLVTAWPLNARIIRSDEPLLVLVVALRLTKRETSLTSHTLSGTDLFDSLLEPVDMCQKLGQRCQSDPSTFPVRLTALVSADNRTS